jgi:thiamine pyrophosphate-dependent acetolactate synthase large subunit-like protein
MGVAGEKVEDPETLGPALQRAYDSGKPAVIDVSIDGSV